MLIKKLKFFKIFLISAVLFSLGVLILTSCAKKEISNIASRGKNIICFGDSLTFGYGVEPEESYPEALSKLTRIPVINAGVDGDTSSEGLQRIERDVLDKDPLLVIIEFSGNDFLDRVPVEETIKNMEAMIVLVQRQGAMVAVVDISSGMIMAGYGKHLKALAAQNYAIFIPQILNGILTNSALKSDFLHPNGDGYQIIAQRIYRAILPYLNKNAMIRKFGK